MIMWKELGLMLLAYASLFLAAVYVQLGGIWLQFITGQKLVPNFYDLGWVTCIGLGSYVLSRIRSVLVVED